MRRGPILIAAVRRSSRRPPRPGKGRSVVARDGGVFSFGGAPFFGSAGGMRLAQPVAGMASA